jgi:hypothetical protein
MQRQIVTGYTITDRINIGDSIVVLGENPNAPCPYVTWIGRTSSQGYFWGHYFARKPEALADFYHRAFMEAKDLIPEKEARTPLSKANEDRER